MMKAPVWTWEVPLYFWTGGIASGSAFVALACDLAGDHRSARIARLVSLGALAPVAAAADPGPRPPGALLNMLRVVKTRSPMSMGAWALTLFGNLIAGAVGADLLGRERTARALGGATAVVGGYLGSYTGVLLAEHRRPAVGALARCSSARSSSAPRRRPARPPRASCWSQRRRVRASDADRAAPRAGGRDGRGARALDGQRAPARRARRAAAPQPQDEVGEAARQRRPRPAAPAGAPAARRPATRPPCCTCWPGLLFRYAWVEAGPVSARDDRVRGRDGARAALKNRCRVRPIRSRSCA